MQEFEDAEQFRIWNAYNEERRQKFNKIKDELLRRRTIREAPLQLYSGGKDRRIEERLKLLEEIVDSFLPGPYNAEEIASKRDTEYTDATVEEALAHNKLHNPPDSGYYSIAPKRSRANNMPEPDEGFKPNFADADLEERQQKAPEGTVYRSTGPGTYTMGKDNTYTMRDEATKASSVVAEVFAKFNKMSV